MARLQHILALCVAAFLLATGSSAADADAATAAAQAAATPIVPQTSTNVASAIPDSSVRVSQQTAREKAGGRTGTNGVKPASSPSPAPAVAKPDAGMNPAVPVSGKQPPSFPGAVGAVTTPATSQQGTAASGSIAATFPGAVAEPAQKASPAATTGQAKSIAAANLPAATIPADSAATPEPAAAAPAGAEEKKAKKAKTAKKEKAAGAAEGAVSGKTADGTAGYAASPGGSATAAAAAKVPQNVRTTALDAELKPDSAAVATPAIAKTEAVSATLPTAVATPAGAGKPVGASAVAKAEAIPAPVPAVPIVGASATAKPISAAALAEAEAIPASVPTPGATGASASAKQVGASATAAAVPAAASAAAAKPATPAAEQQVKAAAPQAAAKKAKHIKAAAAPGAAAAAGKRRSLLAQVEPEGTLYDGQGHVVQSGIPTTAPVPSRASVGTASVNSRSGQVATTDVSDRSAVALDRAAMVAAKMAPARAPAALAAAMAPAPFGTSEVVNGFYAANPGAATSFQSTGGSGDWASAAQTALSGLAKNLNSATQQAAAAQGTGVAAQPYASAAQSAPARYSATPQQASAGTAQSAPASYSAIPQQASANAGSSSGAANAGNGNSGVLSGTSYQSSGATSPLTPYNTAMDNSIGNMGKQLGSLLKTGGQQSSSLQQQTPTVDAANAFQQPQLPSNRDIVHLNIPVANAGSALGRRLQDAAGEQQQMGTLQGGQNMESTQSYGAATATPAAAGGNILQSTVGRLQDAAYSLHNKFEGADISSMPMAATISQPVQAAAAPTAGARAGVAQALTPQWTIDPSLQQPSAGSAGGQQSASSGSSAQPMGASVITPYVAAPAAGSMQGVNVASAQSMAASEASAAPAHVAGTNPSGALQAPATVNQVPLPSSMQTGTAANAVADGMQRAVENAQGMRYARAARSATPQAISATAMAASEQSAAPGPSAPAVADALAMAAAAPQQQGAQQQQAQPTIASASIAAPQQQAAQPNQHQASSSAKQGLTQIGASGTEPMGADVSSAQPMAASSGSPLNSNGGVLVNAGRPTSMEQSLGGTTGFVAGVMAGRRLQQATAQKPDGSLQSIVHDAVNDPSTQAAFAHVMEAAATETKALSQLSGPATAPAPGSVSTLTALSSLVSSVSHNALASALPGQPPSNQQQFNDWENSLQSPAAKQAKQNAAHQDAGAVKGFDAAAAGKALAQQVDKAASGVLLGIGRRRLAQEQAQPSLDLDPYVKSLQEVGSGFQEAGQAAGNAIGLTPARLQAAGAQLQEGTQSALIGAAKHVVRTIGVDSNTPGSDTPGSEYGYNPISSVVPYSASTPTAPARSTSSIQSATLAAPQATGSQQDSSAASTGAADNASAAQQPTSAAAAVMTGRKLRADDAQAQAQTQAQAQAQTSEQTANTVKALINGVSSLASVVKNALAPAQAAPAAPVPAAQQTVVQNQVPQTQAVASSTAAQPQVSQQGATPSAVLQSQYGGASASQGGHVGITEATTFAGENGNQLSANDIHLDNTPSSFVIGPDGKVPSLVSQGGAAAVAQQQGLLVPNGAAGSQSVSASPGSYGSGNGAGAGSASSGNGPSSGTSAPSYGYGANSPPASGNGASGPPSSGSSGGNAPSYGSSGGSTSTPAYGSGSAASSPPTGASSVPGTVTAYNQGQSFGSSQQSNASGGSGQSNNSGPSVQGTSFANATPTQQYQPQQGTTQAAASFQQAMAPMQG